MGSITKTNSEVAIIEARLADLQKRLQADESAGDTEALVHDLELIRVFQDDLESSTYQGAAVKAALAELTVALNKIYADIGKGTSGYSQGASDAGAASSAAGSVNAAVKQEDLEYLQNSIQELDIFLTDLKANAGWRKLAEDLDHIQQCVAFFASYFTAEPYKSVFDKLQNDLQVLQKSSGSAAKTAAANAMIVDFQELVNLVNAS